MSERPDWKTAKEYRDITYRKSGGVARIAFNRPEVRNSFRPETLLELQDAFKDAGEDSEIGVVLFTGEGPAADAGGWTTSPTTRCRGGTRTSGSSGSLSRA